jgi:hypothetical protein
MLISAVLMAAFGAIAPEGPSAVRGLVPAAVAADEAPRKTVDADAVFFGDAREWAKPAEVDADAVYAQIEEYKKIVDDKIDPSDPKYGVLMSKARKRFLHAVRAVAKDGGYDLVARLGSVQGVENVPNITQDVIGKL